MKGRRSEWISDLDWSQLWQPCTHRPSDSIDIDDDTLGTTTQHKVYINSDTLGMRLWTSKQISSRWCEN